MRYLRQERARIRRAFHLHPCCIEVVVLDTWKDLQERKKVDSFLGGLWFTLGKGLCCSLGPFVSDDVASPRPHCVCLYLFLPLVMKWPLLCHIACVSTCSFLFALLSPPLPFSCLLPTRPASFPPLFLLGTKGRRERHASGLPSPPGLVATTTTSPFVVVGFFPWKKLTGYF